MAGSSQYYERSAGSLASSSRSSDGSCAYSARPRVALLHGGVVDNVEVDVRRRQLWGVLNRVYAKVAEELALSRNGKPAVCNQVDILVERPRPLRHLQLKHARRKTPRSTFVFARDVATEPKHKRTIFCTVIRYFEVRHLVYYQFTI